MMRYNRNNHLSKSSSFGGDEGLYKEYSVVVVYTHYYYYHVVRAALTTSMYLRGDH